MTSESLGKACRDNYDSTVIKVLMSRIPENGIKTILASCNSLDSDCKVISFSWETPGLLSLPCLVLVSLRRRETIKVRLGTRMSSYQHYKQTEDNLEFVRKLPKSIRKRIKLQIYEDLAIKPLKELSRLSAGLTVLESVRTWLNETRQLSRKACNHKMDGVLVTCTNDDAWAAANRWRCKVHPHEINVIEHYCRGVLRLMGYRGILRITDE